MYMYVPEITISNKLHCPNYSQRCTFLLLISLFNFSSRAMNPKNWFDSFFWQILRNPRKTTFLMKLSPSSPTVSARMASVAFYSLFDLVCLTKSWKKTGVATAKSKHKCGLCIFLLYGRVHCQLAPSKSKNQGWTSYIKQNKLDQNGRDTEMQRKSMVL